MFNHVLGDRLDQRKYPWIGLSDAAVYMLSPTDAGRLAAVEAHDWERPFLRLFEWIEEGTVIVYDGTEAPFKPIPKEEFFGVPIKYPTYPREVLLSGDIGLHFKPGEKTYIDCNSGRVSFSRVSPVVDQYYIRGNCEPRWRDLKIDRSIWSRSLRP